MNVNFWWHQITILKLQFNWEKKVYYSQAISCLFGLHWNSKRAQFVRWVTFNRFASALSLSLFNSLSQLYFTLYVRESTERLWALCALSSCWAVEANGSVRLRCGSDLLWFRLGFVVLLRNARVNFAACASGHVRGQASYGTQQHPCSPFPPSHAPLSILVLCYQQFDNICARSSLD